MRVSNASPQYGHCTTANSVPAERSSAVDSTRRTGSRPYFASISASLRGFSGGFMRFRARMIARLALVVGIGLVTAGYSKCVFVSDTGGTTGGSDGNGDVGGAGTFSTTLVLRDSAGVATTSFVFGEQIRFDLEVRNLSALTSHPDLPRRADLRLRGTRQRLHAHPLALVRKHVVPAGARPSCASSPIPARPTASSGTAS